MGELSSSARSRNALIGTRCSCDLQVNVGRSDLKMAFNFAHFTDLIERINLTANLGRLTPEDVDRREMEAFNQLHQGNAEEAVRLYTQLILQLENQLDRDREGSVDEQNVLEEGNNERDELERKLQQIKDQRMALMLAHELNPEFNFRDAALANGTADGGTLPLVDEGRDIDDRQRVLDYYEKRAQYFFRLSCPFHLIAAILVIAFSLVVTDPCADSLKLMLYTFFIFFPFNFLIAALASWKLRKIDGDLEQLEHITRTAYIQTLWPPGTWQHRVDVIVDFVNVIGRLAWIVVALIIITSFDAESCDAGPLGSFLYIVIFFGNLNQWGVIAAIGLIIVIAIVCCPCLTYIVYYVYQEIAKEKPVGMQKKELKQLPQQKYYKGMVQSDDDDDPICVVCQLEFEEGEDVRQLPCEGKHVFHKECVDIWLKKNDTCPLCKTHFSDKGKEREAAAAAREQNQV